MGVDGAIAAAPVTDTVKEAYPDGTVMRTLDRSRLWAVQTPQVFRADVAAAGARRGRRRAGGRHRRRLARRGRRRDACGWSRRPPENFKVTTEADLARAEAALC